MLQKAEGTKYRFLLYLFYVFSHFGIKIYIETSLLPQIKLINKNNQVFVFTIIKLSTILVVNNGKRY